MSLEKCLNLNAEQQATFRRIFKNRLASADDMALCVAQFCTFNGVRKTLAEVRQIFHNEPGGLVRAYSAVRDQWALGKLFDRRPGERK